VFFTYREEEEEEEEEQKSSVCCEIKDSKLFIGAFYRWFYRRIININIFNYFIGDSVSNI